MEVNDLRWGFFVDYTMKKIWKPVCFDKYYVILKRQNVLLREMGEESSSRKHGAHFCHTSD